MNNDAESERRAIEQVVSIEAYDPCWPARFAAERDRLSTLAPELIAIEHIGSTAVPGLAAKPVVDIMAAVPSLEVADQLVDRLCAHGYVTSAEFNRTLNDRRWLMRHAAGRRTHHLHLLLAGSPHWTECLRFRDMLRANKQLREDYAELKRTLAAQFGGDRDGYTEAKSGFIALASKPLSTHVVNVSRASRSDP